MKSKIRKLLRKPPVRFLLRVVRTYLDHRVPRAAAALAYYMLMCIFPLIIVAFAVVGLLPLTPEDLLRWMEGILPGTSETLVGEYATYVLSVQSPGLLTAGLVLTVTASSAGFRGVLSISSEVYGHRTYTGLRYVVVSIVMSVVLVLTIYASLVVVVTGRWLKNLILALGLHLPIGVWQWLRFPLLLAMCILALCAIYRASVSKKHSPGVRVLPGAAASSLGLVLGTAVFSSFISASARLSMVYGSLASTVILLLWFFFCANILLLGHIINYTDMLRRENRI